MRPEKSEGKWAIDVAGAPPASYTLAIRQEYQRISGYAGPGVTTLGLREPMLRGERIRFSFVDDLSRLREFSGMVSGAMINGDMRTNGENPVKFTARRTGD